MDFFCFREVTKWIWERLEGSNLPAVEIEAIPMQVGPVRSQVRKVMVEEEKLFSLCSHHIGGS